MDIALYDYQEQSIEALRENIRRGVKNQILAAPTGSGKTVCAAYLLHECWQKKRRAVFVADRISLIDQTSALLDAYGIPHGVIQADHWRRRPWENIQVASAATLARRQWPQADLVIIDECHTVQQTVVRRVSRRDVVTIGLTATPFTKGLGKHYDAVVSVTTTNKLIEAGKLAPFRVFAASEPDMTGVKVVAGEWQEDQVAERAMPIIGDCVTEYLKHGHDKKFIAFGVNVAHCEEMQRQFMEAGVQCGLYTYRTGEAERAQMIEEFKRPDSYLRGLISVSALAKGFDREDVEIVIIARPLRSSFAEHIQIIGRGLRRDPNNPAKVCTVLDHAGNMMRFWPQMQEFFAFGATELDDGKRKEQKPKPKKEREPMKCGRCAHVHAPRPMCPACGFEYPRRNDIRHEAGELAEIAGAESTQAQRSDLYAQLLYIARDRGYATGWAAWKFKERVGVFPPRAHPEPVPPTPALLRWVRSQAIRYAKSKRAA